MSRDYASRLAEAMDSLGGDDETIIAWAEGVRSLGAEVERAEVERDALAARVKELEARIERALAATSEPAGWSKARRILRGEDDTTGGEA